MAIAKEVLGSYSPEDVVVILHNSKFSHQISGYTEGSFLEITRVVPHATPYNGADGTNARVVRAVKNADITLTLHQSGESNDVLSALLVADEASRNGDDIFAITIKDTSGRSIYSSAQAYIGTTPDAGFAQEIADRAWTIHAINLSQHLGGNARLTPDAAGALSDLGHTVEDRWQVTEDLTP